MPKWTAVLLTGALLSVLVACGNDQDSPDNAPPPRAEPGFTKVSYEPIDIDKSVEPKEDALYTRLLHYKLTDLGTVKTVNTKNGPARPAPGETFYAATFEVTVNDRFLKQLENEWGDFAQDRYDQSIKVGRTPVQIFDDKAISRLVENDELVHNSFSVVTSASDSDSASFEVSETGLPSDEVGEQGLDLRKGRPAGEYRAVEPVYLELDEIHRSGDLKNMNQYAEDEAFHEMEFSRAMRSTRALDLYDDGDDYHHDVGTAVTIRACWRFKFNSSGNVEGGYKYESTMKLVDSKGKTYTPVASLPPGETDLAYEDIVVVDPDQGKTCGPFTFAVPKDELEFEVIYTPRLAVGAFFAASGTNQVDLGTHKFTIDLSKSSSTTN